MSLAIDFWTEATPNPHLKLVTPSIENIIGMIISKISENRQQQGVPEDEKIQILDIGGGRGFGDIFTRFENCEYNILDIENHKNIPNVIVGDITDQSLNVCKKFDLVFTKDTQEHILNPWDSTQNILNLLKEGGYFFFIAPFAWRYHASPVDTYRYTHTGARYLFERLGGMKQVCSGYKYNSGGGSGWYKTRTDQTMTARPFGESISTIYIATRDSAVKFNRTTLDFDNQPHTRL